jgi:hypothetical protein
MTDLSLRDDLVQRLHEIAQRENRRIDEIVETLLNHYDPFTTSDSTQEDILRQDRLRIYDRARYYWQSINDDRQYLSNEELDNQFWLIDHNGIPRLKSEQADVNLPPDPLEQMLNLAEADHSIQWRNIASDSERTKDILNSDYTDHLLSRLNRPSMTDDK